MQTFSTQKSKTLAYSSYTVANQFVLGQMNSRNIYKPFTNNISFIMLIGSIIVS